MKTVTVNLKIGGKNFIKQLKQMMLQKKGSN